MLFELPPRARGELFGQRGELLGHRIIRFVRAGADHFKKGRKGGRKEVREEGREEGSGCGYRFFFGLVKLNKAHKVQVPVRVSKHGDAAKLPLFGFDPQ